jgi:3(or 17)beta-hydroxysteroid dehydrogenase
VQAAAQGTLRRGREPRLARRVALVTGAARGIGEAIAEAFRAEGAQVIVSDIDERGGRATAERLGAAWIALDVREELAWIGAMARLLDSHGRLDVLVNNAGITGLEGGATHDPEHSSLADWHAVHRTNLDGVFLGCKHAIRTMRRAIEAGVQGPGGSIVNISSRSGLVGVPAAAAYASSKAAVRNHTKSVALYCAQQGLPIRCNSIHPAAMLTPMWEPMLGEGAQRQARLQVLVADVPLRRFGLPCAVAALALTLATDEAACVTGSEFHVDGGMLAGRIPSQS